MEILSFAQAAELIFAAAERFLIGASDLNDPYLMTSLRILNLIVQVLALIPVFKNIFEQLLESCFIYYKTFD